MRSTAATRIARRARSLRGRPGERVAIPGHITRRRVLLLFRDVASRIHPSSAMTGWTDLVDEILDGDHAVMLAYVTPAGGVVLAPVSNFGLHDRASGVVTVNTSVGAWKKLDRIRRNPR